MTLRQPDPSFPDDGEPDDIEEDDPTPRSTAPMMPVMFTEGSTLSTFTEGNTSVVIEGG